MEEQKRVALVISLVLLARGFLGFVFNPAPLFGLFSTTLNHDFLHLLGGTAYLWVAVYVPRERTTCGWNKFLGWLYLFIGVLGVMDIGVVADKQFYGHNSFADNVFNFAIAFTSITCGYHFRKIRRVGVSFLKALNFPFGKT